MFDVQLCRTLSGSLNILYLMVTRNQPNFVYPKKTANVLWMCVCVRASGRACGRVRARACVRACVRSCVRVCVRVCVYVCMRVYYNIICTVYFRTHNETFFVLHCLLTTDNNLACLYAIVMTL